MISNEPEPLKRGKRFQKVIQAEWAATAQRNVRSERWVLKQCGRRGRVDVFVDDSDPEGSVAIVEIKATDWDRMTDKAVRRNSRRQKSQVVGYIESQIKAGGYMPTGEQKSVSPIIIFPKQPRDPQRRELIENLFLQEGIVVV